MMLRIIPTPVVARLQMVLLALLVCTCGIGCQSDAPPEQPRLTPGVYEIRLRLNNIQGSNPCFDPGAYIMVDTVCVPEDMLELAGVQSCPFSSEETGQDGRFTCQANRLWNQCPSDIHFDGRVDVIDPSNFLVLGIWKVRPGSGATCTSSCQTLVSFEGKWLKAGGCLANSKAQAGHGELAGLFAGPRSRPRYDAGSNH